MTALLVRQHPATYDDLQALPETVTGEIVGVTCWSARGRSTGMRGH